MSHNCGPLHSFQITPKAPFFYFVPADPDSFEREWNSHTDITTVFLKRSTGTETGFDELMIGFDNYDLASRLARFTQEQRYGSKIGIKGGHAEELLRQRAKFSGDPEAFFRMLQLRPFDYRVAFLKKELLKTNSFNVMLDLTDDAPGLVTTRQTKESFVAFAVDGFCGHKCTSSYDRSYVFPTLGRVQPVFIQRRRSHVSRKMLAHFRDVQRLPCGRYSDEEASRNVHAYALAVLNAPSYSLRFGRRLRRDWPRLPVTFSCELLQELVRLGGELTAFHLVKSPLQRAVTAFYDRAVHAWRYEVSEQVTLPITIEFDGPERPVVGTVRWSDDTVWIDAVKPKKSAAGAKVTATVGFRGVPEEVWNFHIGGYQVCEKWLKDRRGRTLTAEDITHYHRIVIALHETIRIMREIDEVIDAHGGWPDAFRPAGAASSEVTEPPHVPRAAVTVPDQART